MGQKISVELFRAKQKLSNSASGSNDITSTPKSVWFATGRSYSKLLAQDVAIREFIENKLKTAGLAKVTIKRYFRKVEDNAKRL